MVYRDIRMYSIFGKMITDIIAKANIFPDILPCTLWHYVLVS